MAQIEDNVGWLRLAGGILIQALKDAVDRQYNAEWWLRSEDCMMICDALNINHAKVIQWLEGDRELPKTCGPTRGIRKNKNRLGIVQLELAFGGR
jgi:hypothetical protein